MSRTVWTKPQSDPNGTWTRHFITPPAYLPLTGGVTYDVRTDAGDVSTVTALASNFLNSASIGPITNGQAEINVDANLTNAPLDLFVLFNPAGNPAPTEAQMQAGQDNTGTPADFWINGFTFSTAQTGTLVTLDATATVSATYDVYFAVRDANDQFSDVIVQTGFAVDTTGSSFTETPTTFDGTQFLVADAQLPADATSLFGLFSIQMPNDFREALVSWDGFNGHIYGNSNTGDNLVGPRVEVLDSAGVRYQNGNETVPVNTRYHLAVASWLDGVNLRTEVWIRPQNTGVWEQAMTDTSPTAGTAFVFTPNNLTLFARSDNTSQHRFTGTVWRAGLWTRAGFNAPLIDLTNATARAGLHDGNSVNDPAIVRAELSAATRHFDMVAPADYSGAVSNGVANLTLTGTFA